MSRYCMKCMLPLENGTKCPHCGYAGEQKIVPHRLKPGTVLSERYLIGNAIGQGGFGITYIGRDQKLQMRVAVKEYYPNGYTNRNSEVSARLTIVDKAQRDFIEAGKQKFLKEARSLAEFHDNPGVVDVRDYFEENDTAYIVMEYLDGEDLRTHLKKSLFSADEIFRRMDPVMESLERIHEAGIIHRDISPDNIMMLKNGSLKLMDFGAARQADDSGQQSRSVVLKAGYAPEEQYRPRGIQGPWTDIYALCGTIYKCITGITPPDALDRYHHDEIRWPSEMGFTITPTQEAVLKKGMAINREDRFPNVRELRKALERDKKRSGNLEVSDSEEDECTVAWKHGSKDTGSQEKESSVNFESGSAAGLSNKKKVFLALLSLAAVVVLIMAFAAWNRKSATTGQLEETSGESGNIDAKDAGSVEESVGTVNRLHISLTPDSAMSLKEYNAALEIIRGRLDILAGEGNYEMISGIDRIDLQIPEAAFLGVDREKVLRCYISRAMRLYAFNAEDNREKILLERSDLDEVSLLTGSVEGVDASEYGMESETYPYLKIVLTDTCAQTYQEEIESWGDQLRFGQDMATTSGWYYHDTFPEGDGKTFYIINSDAQGAFDELLVYNLTHDSLTSNFSYSIDVNDLVDWEDPEDASICGKNQQNFAQISGKTITITYSMGSGELSQGNRLDLEAALKSRLDTLGQPYAVGVLEDDTESMLAVTTEVGHMGNLIMEMIGAKTSQVYVVSGFEHLAVWQGSESDTFVWESGEDNLRTGRLKLSTTSRNELAEILENPEDPVFLTLDDMPYLKGHAELTEDGGAVVFDQVLDEDWTALTGDYEWFLNLWQEVISGTPMPFSCTVRNWQMNPDEAGEYATAADFRFSYREAVTEISGRIHEVFQTANVWENGGKIYVLLDLPVDDELPEQALSLVKEIYENSGFADSVFSELMCYLVTENEDVRERARIYFDKAYYAGKLQSGCTIANGRLEEYKEEFRKRMEEDSFLAEIEKGIWLFAW